jgi:hypothetical protein
LKNYEVIAVVGTTVTKVVNAENQMVAVENLLKQLYAEYTEYHSGIEIDIIDVYELED